MDPLTMGVIGQGIGAIGKIASTPPAGPSRADGLASATNSLGSAFDGSGWTVSTGSSKANGATMAKGLTFNPLVIGAVVLVGLYLLRKHA